MLDESAEVRAHDRVTRYRRFGTGPVVVLLRTPDRPEPWSQPLIDALRESFRVIEPETPADVSLGEWLPGFLEGLGVAGASIVATCSACAPMQSALLETDQIARVVLIPDGAGRSEDIVPIVTHLLSGDVAVPA